MFDRSQKIFKTYIITVLNNNQSVLLSNRALNSCKKNDIDVDIWEAFDGTQNNQIKIPPKLVNQHYIGFLKVKNYKLITEEIALWLSHFSLWCHCLQIDKPIVILEHDAVMLKKVTNHSIPNTIEFLGHISQRENKNITCDVNIEGYGYKFMRGAHAYSIDPLIAKILISEAIKDGITKPLDVFLRSDVFAIFQRDLYAIVDGKFSMLSKAPMYQEINERVNYG